MKDNSFFIALNAKTNFIRNAKINWIFLSFYEKRNYKFGFIFTKITILVVIENKWCEIRISYLSFDNSSKFLYSSKVYSIYKDTNKAQKWSYCLLFMIKIHSAYHYQSLNIYCFLNYKTANIRSTSEDLFWYWR